MTAVDERVRAIESRLELGELPARYARALDDRDMAALLALFCEDATFCHGDGRPAARGLDEIDRYFRSVLGRYSFSIHVPHAQVIERLEEDAAAGWVAGHAEIAEGGRLASVAMRYDDDYRRVDGTWRFARRTNRLYYFAEWSELGAVAATRDRLRFRGDPRPADLPESLESYQRFVAART